MDIRQIQYFATVAQLQNFSRAADLLHISQSSLSKQIARLESELGVTLFDRNGKRVRLNRAGMRFYDSCLTILQEVSSAEDDLRLFMRNQDHRIRIGSAGMPELMLQCLSAFSSQYPKTEWILNSRIEEETHLNINDYDALICPEEQKFETLKGYPLFQEGYYFAVPARNDLASEKAFSPWMLTGHASVFLRGAMLVPEYSFQLCSALAVPLHTICFTDNRDMHRRMIASGLAVGFVPKSEAGSYQRDPEICLLPIMDSRFSRAMKICFLRDKHLSDMGIRFKDFVIEYFHLVGV